jgi:superfamily II DNA or RNA helicase
VLGLEIIRRLGRPALVLAPTSTIQQQWSDKLRLFTDRPACYTGDGGPLHLYTYQLLCQTADPDGSLREAAIDRLVHERAAGTSLPVDQVRAEVWAYRGHAESRFERDITNTVAALKREIARGEHLDVDLEALLKPSVRDRIQDLVGAGVGTLVLDECHHLASMWGYLVRTVIAALTDVHVVGLTATSPSDLPADAASLYSALLGPVDFTVPHAGSGTGRLPCAVSGAGLLHYPAGQ